MMEKDSDQELVAAALASAPAPEVSPSFLARLNARIDAERNAGWLALADFRTWTLRLVPAAAVLALIAALWPGATGDGSAPTRSSASSSSSLSSSSSGTSTHTFTPSSAGDWQQDVSGNAMIEAALTGGHRVR